jgi:asparagine synthase (glutamine-hydrolysing)
MCGIAGFGWSGNGAPGDAAGIARRMADRVHHRGPDDADVWVDPAGGIALGHRRLSIVDLSPHGRQPMRSACGRFAIVYNGEIYNHRALRDELERAGAASRWRGHSDTEVMLAAVARWGVREAVRRFNGMFAFALWDTAERTLWLSRDRLGEKPLYYGWVGRVFAFASELKAFQALPDWRPAIDPGAVTLYFRYNCIPAPHTIYRGIAKLPPATLLRVPLDDARPGVVPGSDPYWSALESAEAGVGAPQEPRGALDRLDTLLRDAVALRMEADVPLGAFLSGGVDSSLVVALMQAQAARPVRTFTIGFTEEDYDEAASARAVAAHLGTDHTELYVTPAEAMGVIPSLPLIYDEPFADSSQIPTYLVSALARRHVTVALSGDGGDEVFGGYNRHAWVGRLWRSAGRVPVPVRRWGARVALGVAPARWDAVLGALRPLVAVSHPGDSVHKLAQVIDAPNAHAMYRGLVSHWDQPASLVLGGHEPSSPLDEARVAALPDVTDRMMYLDQVSYLPDDILVKVDRASMAVSLETRAPYLDHRVVEFAWTLPLGEKVSGGEGKRVLRRLLAQYVPRALTERPKLGFGVPIGAWLRGPLREWAEALLAPDRLRREGILDPVPIRRRWEEHLSGGRSWQYHLWDVLMFQAWLDSSRGD